ncbi:MAG: DUF4215 domain-containing protein [Sandaracinaceae bacterium]|nr:DUF4215 domain-containing protein [Sandaracinaceae bacterium]
MARYLTFLFVFLAACGSGVTNTDGGADGSPDGAACIDQCTAEGAACDGDDLVTCARDATTTCLVEARANCAATGGTCDPSTQACSNDPCASVPPADRCATAGRTCDADTLIDCALNAQGCLEATRTDCSATPGATCEVGATTMCVGTGDPCEGVPTDQRCTTAGTTCDGDTLRVCAPNAFGCLVSTATDCAASGDTCGTNASGTTMCGDPCDFVEVCPAAGYCDGAQAVTCAADADGCLVETGRVTCSGSACAAGQCRGSCGVALAALDCSSGVIAGNTATGSSVFNTYQDCILNGSYPGNESVYFFTHDGAPVDVRVEATRTSGTADYDLFVLAGNAACGDGSTCVDAATDSPSQEVVQFHAMTGSVYYVAFDAFDSTETAQFTLSVSCRPSSCGDGVVGVTEECDDGGNDPMDGCSATCTIEAGYTCAGSPSVCTMACGNGNVDGGEQCDDGNTMPSDGCSELCAIEAGYVCNGMPSVCVEACGNGTIETRFGESCDDGNRMASDGCSPSCVEEPGWACTGEPSMCRPESDNGTCASAIPLTGTITADVRVGGARPSGALCGSGSPPPGPALYYTLSVPGRTQTIVTATPTTAWDLTLHARIDCAATGCSAISDTAGTTSGTERLAVTNDTDDPITRIIVVAATSVGGGGPITITTASQSVPYTSIPAACETAPGAGVTTFFTTGDKGTSPFTALPFPFRYFGADEGYYSVSINGLMQLFPAMSGVRDPQPNNRFIPTMTDPNSMICPFWDDLAVNAGGAIRSWVTGTAPDRKLVVEWNNMGFFGLPGASLRFQAQLYETSNRIEMHYCSLAGSLLVVNGSGATMGVEDALGMNGRLASFNTRDAVTTGSAFRF